MIVEMVNWSIEVLFLWVEFSIRFDAFLNLLNLVFFLADHLLMDTASWFMHQCLG